MLGNDKFGFVILTDEHVRAAGADPDLRALVRVLVLPLAEMLEDPTNHFLGFLARYHVSRPRRELMATMDPAVTTSYQDVARLLHTASGLSKSTFGIRFGLALDLCFTSLAGRQREEIHRTGRLPARQRFIDNLFASVIGIFLSVDETR